MGAIKNMVRGTIVATIYVIVTIVIPFITFSWLQNLGEVAGSDVGIGMSPERYNNIIFWVSAFGLLISGCAFFAFSAPSQSIRRGIFCLIMVFLNTLYIWSYKFSGALEIELNLFIGDDTGTILINLEQAIMIVLALYFLTIILKTYDLIDFTVNREKIREARKKGEKYKR